MGRLGQQPPRQFYQLTSLGKQRLRDESAGWNRLAGAMAAALRATSQEI